MMPKKIQKRDKRSNKYVQRLLLNRTSINYTVYVSETFAWSQNLILCG